MRVALLDLLESPRGCNNKEVTGTYGSTMTGEGGMSSVFAWLKRRKLRMPVVSMGYLNAIFRQAGHEVLICEKPPKEACDLVLMPTSIVGAREEQEAAREIKRRHPNTLIGFFGAFPRVDKEPFLAAGDFIIVGEPEAWAMKFANDFRVGATLGSPSLTGGASPAPTMNIIPRLTGLIDSEEIKDLDTLPDPDWTGFPVATYRYGPMLSKSPFLPLTTARGCPYDCFYCPYMVDQGKVYRRHSIPRVMGQIKNAIEKHGVKSILFRDIVFSMNKKRTRELCEAIISSGLKFQWGAETRIDCLDEDLVRLMRQSGCEALHFGVESSDNAILEEAGRRGMELDHQMKMVSFCEGLGIKVVCFYILGFVSDTVETMEKTIDYACRLNSSVAQFGIMTPYPGTRLFDQVQDRLLTRDWTQYNTYNTVVRLDHVSSQQVLEAKKRAYRRYYLRAGWIGKRVPKLLGLS
ncbi:MAG: radical SAM protein [Planctomycetota bacterium]